MEEKDVIDEIVTDTIKFVEEMPFGITDDEMESQEVIEEIIENKGGEDNAGTN